MSADGLKTEFNTRLHTHLSGALAVAQDTRDDPPVTLLPPDDREIGVLWKLTGVGA
jgi:hypothetical protein